MIGDIRLANVLPSLFGSDSLQESKNENPVKAKTNNDLPLTSKLIFKIKIELVQFYWFVAECRLPFLGRLQADHRYLLANGEAHGSYVVFVQRLEAAAHVVNHLHHMWIGTLIGQQAQLDAIMLDRLVTIFGEETVQVENGRDGVGDDAPHTVDGFLLLLWTVHVWFV